MSMLPERNITAEEATQILDLINAVGHSRLVDFVLTYWIIESKKYCSDSRIKEGLSLELEKLLHHNFEVLG